MEWLRVVFRLWILEPDCCMASFMGSSLSTDYMTLVFDLSALFSHQENGERIGQCDSPAVPLLQPAS